ncbi:hypothetical protein BDN72DRAFT_859395 [Pluteus cervinus]|uniref:Uncharacterized protein n=1 Tax=Pluteus cervinus TaxID=181527 RepID=A0ACD3AP48_9AGAR|nr:hypothetical protein BDN72DRAFT_859395 [Pluteus cervinus]
MASKEMVYVMMTGKLNRALLLGLGYLYNWGFIHGGPCAQVDFASMISFKSHVQLSSTFLLWFLQITGHDDNGWYAAWVQQQAGIIIMLAHDLLLVFHDAECCNTQNDDSKVQIMLICLLPPHMAVDSVAYHRLFYHQDTIIYRKVHVWKSMAFDAKVGYLVIIGVLIVIYSGFTPSGVTIWHMQNCYIWFTISQLV